MTYLLLGLGILILGLALAWQVQRVSPAMLTRWVRRGAAIVALALAAYLLLTGRFGQALPALVGGALLFGRLRGLGARGGHAAGPSPAGRSSEVETAFLRARLDHDTGAVTGTVLRGGFAGRDLGQLGEADLVALYLECLRADEQAARLVEAFLDRGPFARTWRDRLGADTGTRDGPMTPDEARNILGVAEDADEDAIREAHRRLMKANHPDRGGSVYLAAKINQARDCLLGP